MWFIINLGDLFNWTKDGILFYSQQTQGVFEMEWTFETLGVSARQAFVKFIWWFYCFGGRDERSYLARIHTLVPCLITETTWPLSSVTYSYVMSSQRYKSRKKALGFLIMMCYWVCGSSQGCKSRTIVADYRG